MEISCASAPANRKEYISDIAKILVEEYGKKKYYTPEEVKKAHGKSKWHGGGDFSCWAMSIFSSHSDFDKYHEETGEVCNYAEMQIKMLGGLSVAPTANWTEIPAIAIDASWLDFGDVFDGTLEGIGEFIVGIFEGF